MSSMDPARIVQAGYDLLDDRYRDWVATMHEGPRRAFLADVQERIPPGSDVLEVGCGPGTDAPALAAGRRYTGIDLSAVQLAHARALVPNGTFLRADVLEVQLPTESFDAVVALYVLGHVSAARTDELFARIHGWLRPGGWFCASFGTSDNPGGVERRWLGVADMYFSSLPPDRTDALLRSTGFDIHSSESIEEVEPGNGTVTFRWVIARRSDASR
jgi:cyclopropane fatty-acyl-phospholipid synthase-like methyltransferase